MSKYILILLLLVSCGSRKVNKSETKEVDTKKIEQTIVDTSKVVINTDTNVKIIDTSSISEIDIVPIDTTKPFTYNGKTIKNAVLRIKKTKNNITTQSNEKVLEKRDNAVTTNTKAQEQTQIEVVHKDIDRKESLLSYWWVLLLIAIGYIAYKIYDKNKFI